MGTLNVGEKIKIKGGSEAQVISEFGSGGQGTVYKVKYDGSEYALKWYHRGVFKDKAGAFYINLERNIEKGAPTASFLWPLWITEIQKESFGYIMDIRPGGYEELTNFFVGSKKKSQVHFKSFTAITNAAINIIQAFRELHNNGFSYQDINNGNFFINPNTGDVLICDNDNVSPQETHLGIMGKQRWMAPEVVTGGNPDKNSDKFSLAVVLFRLLFINHPLEGSYSSPPCMTKEMEKRYYGTDPVFIYDPDNAINRPIAGTDHNLKLFWGIYPQYLKDLFVRAFSQGAMKKTAPRVIEIEWLNAFFRLRSEIGMCPYCKKEMFYDSENSVKCIECGKKVDGHGILRLKKFSTPIFEGQKIYLWHLDSSRDDVKTIIAEVISNPRVKTMLGFKNVSQYTWTVILPDGSRRPLTPGNVVPIKNDFKIDFIGNPNLISLVDC